jgi:hypothetical protein
VNRIRVFRGPVTLQERSKNVAPITADVISGSAQEENCPFSGGGLVFP